MGTQLRLIRPLILLFVFSNALFLLNKQWLAKWGLDSNVLIIANLLFFVISLVAFYLQKRGVENKNPNVFVRGVMGGMMIKMFLVIVSLMIYVLVWKESFSKMSVLAAMFLYLIYLAVEVAVATKMNKQKNA